MAARGLAPFDRAVVDDAVPDVTRTALVQLAQNTQVSAQMNLQGLTEAVTVTAETG